MTDERFRDYAAVLASIRGHRWRDEDGLEMSQKEVLDRIADFGEEAWLSSAGLLPPDAEDHDLAFQADLINRKPV